MIEEFNLIHRSDQRVDLVVMEMKEYTTFLKAGALPSDIV